MRRPGNASVIGDCSITLKTPPGLRPITARGTEVPQRGPNCAHKRPNTCDRPLPLPPNSGTFNVNASPKLLRWVWRVNSQTVLTGIWGAQLAAREGAGAFVL